MTKHFEDKLREQVALAREMPVVASAVPTGAAESWRIMLSINDAIRVADLMEAARPLAERCWHRRRFDNPDNETINYVNCGICRPCVLHTALAALDKAINGA
jgi:hypothetical protein